MSQQYRTAIIGFGHMHINHVAALYAAHPQVRWVGAADTRPLCPERRVAPYTRQWNLDHLVQTLGLPKTYDDYRELLAQERPEIVIVSCENAQHADVVEACAAAGAHVCVEKPMAESLSAGQTKFPAALSFETKVFEFQLVGVVRLNTPAPGSKSTVAAKEPVV